MRMKAGLLPDVRVGHPKSLVEFDHLVTAPLAGFQSVHHYYAAVSSYQCLQKIRVPTDIITAADDPMIPVDMVRSAPMPACMRLHVVAAGGHLGFLGDRVYPAGGSRSALLSMDRRWLDWQIVAWAKAPTSFACDAQ
jgi:predicted alpha/beta-fold hydrolase